MFLLHHIWWTHALPDLTRSSVLGVANETNPGPTVTSLLDVCGRVLIPLALKIKLLHPAGTPTCVVLVVIAAHKRPRRLFILDTLSIAVVVLFADTGYLLEGRIVVKNRAVVVASLGVEAAVTRAGDGSGVKLAIFRDRLLIPAGWGALEVLLLAVVGLLRHLSWLIAFGSVYFSFQRLVQLHIIVLAVELERCFARFRNALSTNLYQCWHSRLQGNGDEYA